MISAAQDKLYWREFRRAAAVLTRRGYSADDLAEWRRGVTAEVTGRAGASHFDLGRKTQFDEVLRTFRAVSEGTLPPLDSKQTVPGIRQRIAAALETIRPADSSAYLARIAERLGLPGREDEWAVNHWVALVGAVERSARSAARMAGAVPK